MATHSHIKLYILISLFFVSCYATNKNIVTSKKLIELKDTSTNKFVRLGSFDMPPSKRDSINIAEKEMKSMISILYYFNNFKFPTNKIRDSIYNLKLPFDTVRYYKMYDEFNKAGRTFK